MVVQIIYVVFMVVLVAVVLLTAPIWSRFVTLVTARVPWLSRNWSSKKQY